MEKQYKKEYDEFIKSYANGTVSAETVGILISRLAQYFAETNMLLGVKEKHLNKISAEMINKQDENSLKPMAIGKSEILTKNSQEYFDYNEVKIDLQNIDTMINALKSLQRGIANEFAHMGGM